MANKKQKEKKKKIYITIGISAGVIIIVFIAIIASGLFSNKKYKLESDESLYVQIVKTAISIDKLNSSGSTSSKACQAFKDIAKAYDKNTDWFTSSYCNGIFYADYNDTEKSSTVTLYDCNHAAIYVFDKDLDYLLEYNFVYSASKGRGITIDS